jgi:histidinol-phosphate aminotransferase
MRRLWRSVLDQVAPYDAGKSLEAVARELGVDSVLRLSANENPLGPSPRVIEAIRREAPRAHLYPDGGCTEVRQGLASRLGVSPESIVVGNGADELLAMLARAAFDPGDEVLIPHPAFEPYGTEATLSGAVVVASPLRGYDQDLDDMRDRVTPRTKCVILCTPHNPAATIVRRRALERFLDSLGADPPLVVLDEAYRDFCDDDDTADGVVLQRRYPTLLSLRTFSKIAGLAGLRVGYAVARPEHIERLNRVRAPYNVNRLAQVAAAAALGGRAGAAAAAAGRAGRTRSALASLAGQLHPGQGGRAGGRSAGRPVPGRHPGARRRGRGLPRAPAHRGGDRGAERASARGLGPDPRAGRSSVGPGVLERLSAAGGVRGPFLGPRS